MEEKNLEFILNPRKKSVADGDNGSEIEVRVESNSKGCCCVYG